VTESSASDRPRLILGLGNPGSEYRDTRHNLGFRVLEKLGLEVKAGARSLECAALVARGKGLVLAWPQTYMNRSGHAARCLVERHGFEPADLLVVYDDVALPLGRLRLRRSGGPGGHRGMESVIRSLRTDEIARLRLGILPTSGLTNDHDLSDFVLAPFGEDELVTVDDMVQRAVGACRSWLEGSVEAAMAQVNAT
jgi:PTH1 family peptidyl-tRNA hydrolase